MEIELGIDRLIGEAEKALHGGQADRVDRLVERLGSKDDDRAMLLVHRQPVGVSAWPPRRLGSGHAPVAP